MLRTNKIWCLAVVTLIIILPACENNLSGTLEGGMEYTFINKTEGQLPENGEFIALNVLVKDDSDSVITDSQEMGIPVLLRKDSLWGTLKSFQDCFNILRKGDSAIFKMSAKSLFINQLPPGMDSSTVVTVVAGLADVMDESKYRETVTDWQNNKRMEQMAAAKKEIVAANKDLISTQGETIDAYLVSNNLEAEKTESGIRYVITEQGNGSKPEVGDQVKVNYTGKLLDGTVFDSSVEEAAKAAGLFNPSRPYEPYPIQLGISSVILGWHEGIALLSQGDKATLFIPSPLAYGEQSQGEIIKANSILVFDIEMVEVVK